MGRKEKTSVAGAKVSFEVLAGRRGGEGIFGLEDEADELAGRPNYGTSRNGLPPTTAGMRAGGANALAVGRSSGIREMPAER